VAGLHFAASLPKFPAQLCPFATQNGDRSAMTTSQWSSESPGVCQDWRTPFALFHLPRAERKQEGSAKCLGATPRPPAGSLATGKDLASTSNLTPGEVALFLFFSDGPRTSDSGPPCPHPPPPPSGFFRSVAYQRDSTFFSPFLCQGVFFGPSHPSFCFLGLFLEKNP